MWQQGYYVKVLKRACNFLFALIIIVNLYSAALPFSPIVSLWIKRHTSDELQRLNAKVTSPSVPVPKENRIVIPKLILDEPIYEGQSIYTVNKGVWRRPGGSSPDSGGNTVLTGHRFTYHGAAVFYHLDLLKPGDQLGVFWKEKKLMYKVTAVKVVPPSDTSVEAPTDSSLLTLYTCTPLWTAKNRLVVQAERIEP